MASTINLGNNAGIALTVISQESLPVLQKILPVFSAFTADFSADAAPIASVVTTRIPTAQSASIFDSGTGYTATGVSSSAVSITLGKHYHRTVGFSDVELQQGGLPLLMRVFVQPSIYSVCNEFQTDIFAQATIANFGSASYSGSTFVYDNYARGVKDLKKAGAMGDQNVLLNSDYFQNLASDIKNNYVIGDNTVVRDGVIGKLGGAKVWEVPALPSLSQGLVGFACVPSSIAIAARLPQVPQNLAYGEIANVVEPMSKFPLQFRTWYSMDKGATLYTVTVITGVQLGQTSGLKRYTDSTGT